MIAILHHFPGREAAILSGVNRHYTAMARETSFAAKSSNPLDKRLDVCSYILALIKALDEAGVEYDTIRKVCHDAATSYVKPTNFIQMAFKKLPGKLAGTWLANFFFNRLNEKLKSRKHPDGFAAVILTDPLHTYGFGFGFDILECGVCKMFHRHNMDKYTSILCGVDEITSAMAGLKLIRKGTIAMGAEKCDFRYQKLTE